MIARLVGILVDQDGNRGVVDVGGVGYEVFATSRALSAWQAAGEAVTVHVSTQVREDAITLYGFPSALDRQAFQVLIGVSGVGPKMALSCLEALPVDEFARAVERDDVVTLGKINGVGKKTAQRLALELKGKLPVSFAPTSVAGLASKGTAKRAPADPLPLALAQLEYGKSEIDRALQALEQQGIPKDAPVDERLRQALRVLAVS